MKQLSSLIILLSLTLSGLAQQTAPKATLTQRFFELEKSLEEVRKEMASLRQQVREIEVRASMPTIRAEINKLVQAPEITHEIVLNNGTVVRGKITQEDLSKVIIQTNIGELLISKNDIKITRAAAKLHAKCVLDGPISTKIFEDKTIYTGKIKNEGERRADFPQIAFTLYDEATRLVAQDSVIVSGNFFVFKSGVQTDATILPGQSFPFECTVTYPAGSKISYYVPKITWEEFE